MKSSKASYRSMYITNYFDTSWMNSCMDLIQIHFENTQTRQGILEGRKQDIWKLSTVSMRKKFGSDHLLCLFFITVAFSKSLNLSFRFSITVYLGQIKQSKFTLQKMRQRGIIIFIPYLYHRKRYPIQTLYQRPLQHPFQLLASISKLDGQKNS